jgi:5'-phosphate synthase pdxT subunit
VLLVEIYADPVRHSYPLESKQMSEFRLREQSLRPSPMKIGVLALQGDFDAHRRRLEELGAEVVLVKNPEQLNEIDGLVIPGGESGTFLKLLGEEGFEKLKEFVHAKPTFGTCAGAILLATEVENPKQAGLGAIDIGIRRNAYGRQVDSSIREGKLLRAALSEPDSPLEMVFIRAPKIEHVGPSVEIIATEGDDTVAVRQGKVMAATFHPELSDDTRVHQAFLDLCGKLDLVDGTRGLFAGGPSLSEELRREHRH